MINICELEKDLTDVRDEELGAVVGSGGNTFTPIVGYNRDAQAGVNTNTVGIGVNGTTLNYQNINKNGNVLSETYSLQQQVLPGLKAGVTYEGVTKSVTPSIQYNSNNFNANAFAGPGGFGIQVGGSFTF